MKSIKRTSITLLIGIAIAVLAVAIGSGMGHTEKITHVVSKKEIPSVNLIDLNKVFYIFFQK